MRKITVLALLVMTMFFGTFFVFPQGFAPVEKAEGMRLIGTVVPSVNYVTADVAPGKHGMVSVNGVVQVTVTGAGTNVQMIVVTLEGNSGMGWPVTVSPSSMTLKPDASNSASGAFTATISVPPRTSYSALDTVTISGYVQAFPALMRSALAPADITVKVNQFYLFTVSAEKPYKEVTPGDQTAFTLHIKNDGNGVDKFRIEVPEKQKLSEKGWVIALGQEDVQIDEQKEATIVVSVNTPQEFHLWYNKPTSFSIRVYSEQAMLNNIASPPKDKPLTVRERGFSTPGFDPIFMIMAIGMVAAMLAVNINASRARLRRRR